MKLRKIVIVFAFMLGVSFISVRAQPPESDEGKINNCSDFSTDLGWPVLPPAESIQIRDALATIEVNVSTASIYGANEWALAIIDEHEAYLLHKTTQGDWRIEEENILDTLNTMSQENLPETMLDYLLMTFAVASTEATSSIYYLPYESGTRRYVSRAGDDHGNAIDFAMPIGTPILAATDGRIAQIIDGNTRCGCGSDFAQYNNQIKIVNESSGEVAYYLHLATNSVPDNLNVGDYISRGTVIGLSGQIGWTCSSQGGCGPHLHFAVYKNGARLNPYFTDIGGYVRTANSYTSGNIAGSPPPPNTRPLVGDFTGNGTDDLATFYKNTGSWYVATSSGSFLFPYSRWIQGHGIGSINQLVGDFNGDGKVDSAVFFDSTGAWWISLSNGNGFNPYTKWIDGHGAASNNQLVGDFNGDGKDDAAVFFSNSGMPGDWYVSLSTGTGFAPYTKWIGGHGYTSNNQLVGDFNGDGKDDAAVFFSNSGMPGDWYVSLSTGTGFTPYTKWIGGHGYTSNNQLVGDFNGDGKDDAAVFFESSGEWYVSLSTGNTFSNYTQWIRGHGIGSSSQLVGDFNGDGKFDSAVFFAGSSSLYVATSNGTTFNGYSNWIGGDEQSPPVQYIGNFNGDNFFDSVAFIASNGSWSVSLSDGSSLGEYIPWTSGHGVGSNNQLVADFNGDGKDDSAVFFKHTGAWWISLSNGNGFNPYTKWIDGHGAASNNQLVGDFNGDGKDDAAVFFSNSGMPGDWYVSLSTGTGFAPYTKWIGGHGYTSDNQLVGDFNGDGKDDAAVFFSNSGMPGDWYVSLSTGTGFTPYTKWIGGHGYTSNNQLVGDFNGDGKADAAVFFGDTGAWWIALSIGNGLSSPTKWIDGHGIGSTNQVVGDLTGDGKADSVVYFGSEGTLYVAESTSTKFSPYRLWVNGYGDGILYQLFLPLTIK